MSNKIFRTFSSLILMISMGFTQVNQEIDSLRITLITANDSVKFELYKTLSQEYAYIDMDTAKLYADSLELLSEITGNNRQRVISSLLKSNFLYDEGLYQAAETELLSCLKIWKQVQDTSLLARIHLNFGSIYDANGEKDKAIENYHQSIQLFYQLNDSLNAAYLKINLGLLYKSLKDYDRAVSFYRESINELFLLNDIFGYSTSANNLGSLFNDLQNFDSAIFYAQKAKSGYLEMGYAVYSVFPLEVLAAAHKGKMNFSESISFYKDGITIAQQNELNEELLTLYIGLADLYLQSKNTPEALRTTRIAEKLAITNGGLEDRASINDLFFRIYEKNQPLLAITFLKKYMELKDSIITTDKLKVIEELQTKYETAEKEQEIANQHLALSEKESEIKSKKIQIGGLIGGLVIVILFGSIFYSQYRAKQNQKLQAAILMEKERGFESVIQATEEERKRISKDLHDGIGQQLSALKMSLSSVLKKISDSQQQNDLKTILQQFTKSAEEVRQVSHQMMPHTLMDFGLVNAIEDLLHSSFKFSSISYEFEHHLKTQRFDEKIEISLYRVLQELTNNIIKHSGASEISVQLIQNNGKLLLFVEDNGKGMNSDNTKGHGLTNIKSRLDMVKGTVNYEPSPSSGTSATISIPLV